MDKEVLTGLANAGETICDFAVALRKDPLAAEVSRLVDIRSYESGPAFEWYVEATVANVGRVCWALELFVEDGYRVRSAISKMVDGNQEAIHESIKENVVGPEQLTDTLRDACQELVSFTPVRLAGS